MDSDERQNKSRGNGIRAVSRSYPNPGIFLNPKGGGQNDKSNAKMGVDTDSVDAVLRLCNFKGHACTECSSHACAHGLACLDECAKTVCIADRPGDRNPISHADSYPHAHPGPSRHHFD